MLIANFSFASEDRMGGVIGLARPAIQDDGLESVFKQSPGLSQDHSCSLSHLCSVAVNTRP